MLRAKRLGNTVKSIFLYIWGYESTESLISDGFTPGSKASTHHPPSHRRRAGWTRPHQSSCWAGWCRTCPRWSPGCWAGWGPSCCPWWRAGHCGRAPRTWPSSARPGPAGRPAPSALSPPLPHMQQGAQNTSRRVKQASFPSRILYPTPKEWSILCTAARKILYSYLSA